MAPEVLFEKAYGPRVATVHGVLQLTAEQLHEAYPFTSTLVFNETMQRGEFNESNVPPEACVTGSQASLLPPRDHGRSDSCLPERRVTHRWVVGNEQGEILPRYLQNAWIAIESGEELYSNAVRLRVDTPQVARLFAMIREAQLRAVSPFDVVRNPTVPFSLHT